MQEDEHKTHRDNIADMIRQHKSTQEELNTQLTILSSTIDDNKIKIDQATKKRDEVLEEKKQEEAKKNELI